MTCAVNVSVDAIRTHAATVDGVASGVAEAVQAASYLARADDGYGVLPKPLVWMLLDDLHDQVLSAMEQLGTLTAEMPGKLRTAADTFESCDTTRAGDITTKTTEIERNV
ncbi:type VII secretion target [Nocardia sp. NPDC056064]|uniref:type VII secretion target n=1 Tax=unclassified Nocardia TaxID=2637762 RepID=UPI0024187115|nr:type VII secretion target [Nocardia sp. AG03]